MKPIVSKPAPDPVSDQQPKSVLFALTSGSQFSGFILAQGPAQYPHGSYRKQAIEVLHLSARLDDTAKVIAEYWADGPGSATPPGHWNIFAQAISRRDGHTIDEDVKMFFILGNALMDSSIAVWVCKRAADSIRPVSAIRFLFGGKPPVVRQLVEYE